MASDVKRLITLEIVSDINQGSKTLTTNPNLTKLSRV